MSRDFSPRTHWECSLSNPEAYFGNWEYCYAGRTTLLYTDKELEDRKTHKAIHVLGADIFKLLREKLDDDEFEELNETLTSLVEADFGGKSTDTFPDGIITWYYNRNNHHYHEPNDEEFMEFIISDRDRKRKLKDLAKDIFRAKTSIDEMMSGGVGASSYITRLREKDNVVTVYYRYEPVCGLSDCQYHTVQDEFTQQYEFNENGTFKGNVLKTIDPFDDYKNVSYIVDEFFEKHPELKPEEC